MVSIWLLTVRPSMTSPVKANVTGEAGTLVGDKLGVRVGVIVAWRLVV